MKTRKGITKIATRNQRIRKLYKTGLRKYTMRSLGVRFDLSAGMINKILKSK